MFAELSVVFALFFCHPSLNAPTSQIWEDISAYLGANYAPIDWSKNQSIMIEILKSLSALGASFLRQSWMEPICAGHIWQQAEGGPVWRAQHLL